MSIDVFLTDLISDDVTVSGDELRELSKLLRDAYYCLKAKDKQIEGLHKSLRYYKDKSIALEAKKPPKVELSSLLEKYA